MQAERDGIFYGDDYVTITTLTDRDSRAKRDNLPINIKVKYANLKLKLLQWRTSSFVRIGKICSHISFYSLTILGILMASILYLPSTQKAIAQFNNVDTLLIAIGAMLGTMIALVFTLSVIPIQRAVETFSPSVTWMYRNDRVTQFIYFVLALFCLLQFLFAIENVIQVNKVLLLPVGIFMMGASFDLLRWHYRRISQMLDPGEAIKRLTVEIENYISRTQQRLSRLAQIQWDMMTEEQKREQSKRQIESAYYLSLRGYNNQINRWTGELAEISYKAVSKNEIYTSELAIAALVRIACHYLDTRKDNMIVYASSGEYFLSSESDVNTVLTSIYEHMKNINRSAVTLKAETSCIHIVRALGRIASHTASLQSPAFREYSVPITNLPLGYLEECILSAQRNGLDDVVLQGSRDVLNVAKSTPHNVQITDVYLSAIKAWNSMILTFLVTGKGVFANEITKDLMAFLFHLLKQRHYQLNHIISDVLKKIEALIPYAIAHEKMFGSPYVGLPLSVPYDLSNSLSIPYLVAQGEILIKKDEDKEWVNPYHDFIEINETIYRHLRNLAEKIDFGSSFLLWHIMQAIKQIAKVYLHHLDNPVTEDIGHQAKLANQVSWYLSFFWVTFSKASTFNYHRAREACDILAWTGLSFYKYRILYHKGLSSNITESCISNISSIVESYCRLTKNVDPYQIAELLGYLCYIRMLAEKENDKSLMKKIDETIKKPKSLSDERWAEVMELLEGQREHLQNKLIKDRDFNLMDNAMTLLQKLLRQRDNQEAD